MSRRVFVIALIAVLVSACSSSRKMSEVRSMSSEVSIDSLRSREVVTVMDTLREVTTITVVLRQPQDTSFPDDTLRMTTVTDRTKASTRDHYHDVQEKVLLKTDTIYIERTSDSTLIASSPRNLTPDTPGRSFARILKWIFFIIVAVTIFIIVIRIFLKR